jgi:hypothetical protein
VRHPVVLRPAVPRRRPLPGAHGLREAVQLEALDVVAHVAVVQQAWPWASLLLRRP